MRRHFRSTRSIERDYRYKRKRSKREENQFQNEVLNELNDDQLLHYLDDCNNLRLDTFEKALKFHKSTEVILKIIDVGGDKIIKYKNNYGCTALHHACEHKASTDIIIKLVDGGGHELVMAKDTFRRTALDLAFMHKASTKVIMKLVRVGGRQLLMEKNHCGRTAFHEACTRKAPMEVMMELIKVGGRQLLMEKDQYGTTVFHEACFNEVSTEVIMNIIELGGRQLLTEKDQYGHNAFHGACFTKAPTEVIMKVVEVGGHQLALTKDAHGRTALHNAPFEVIILMLKEAIHAQVGEEFGIGGLFKCTPHSSVQHKIYRKWKGCTAPSLEAALLSLSFKHHPPILHAAIIHKAPLHVIEDIIDRFDCLFIRDSLNRLPLHVAVKGGNDNVIHLVTKAMAIARKCSVLHIAGEYGFKWSSRIMKKQVESNADDVVNGRDSLTGLRVFMSAAMGSNDCCDLSSIYGLMRMSPTSRINIS